MALINPSTNRLLEAAGIISSEKKSLKDQLSDAQLDTKEALDIVSNIAHYGENDNIRLRAAEMALKLSGDLRESDNKPAMTVNIVIRDSEAVGINPILIPR